VVLPNNVPLSELVDFLTQANEFVKSALRDKGTAAGVITYHNASAAIEAAAVGDILFLTPGYHMVEDLGELEGGGSLVCFEQSRLFVEWRERDENDLLYTAINVDVRFFLEDDIM